MCKNQHLIVFSPRTHCQAPSRSIQVRTEIQERKILCSPSWKKALFYPWTKCNCPKAKHWTQGCSGGAALWSTLQDYTWTGQLPGVHMSLMSDPCSSVNILQPFLEWRMGAGQRSPSTKLDVDRADFQHFCKLEIEVHIFWFWYQNITISFSDRPQLPLALAAKKRYMPPQQYFILYTFVYCT